MTQTLQCREPLTQEEMKRLFDSLGKEEREILGEQMLTLHFLTNELQQLHAELLERIDKGEEIKVNDFGGLCISFSDERKGETWSKGIGGAEPVCNAFMGTFNAAWEELPEEVFDELIAMAKEKKDIRQEGEKEKEEKKEESPVVDLDKWKVDNQWKN